MKGKKQEPSWVRLDSEAGKTGAGEDKKTEEKKKVVPALANLTTTEKRGLEKHVKKYMKFLDQARIPDLVVDYVEGVAKRNNFGDHQIFVNEDRNNFALVKYGDKHVEEGVRVLGAHVDSPCLHLKDKPIKEDEFTGVRLDTQYYGGIVPYQWFDQHVDVIGHVIKNGKKIPISLKGVVLDVAPHINRIADKKLSEAFKAENLDILTGYWHKEDLLEDLGIEERDFYRADIYAVPAEKTSRLKDLIVGYGHDDRVCVFAQLMALLESKPEHTSIVFGVDREEIGSTGSGSAQATFFEDVLDKVIQHQTGKKSLSQITQPYIRDILSKSMMLSADVDIATTFRNLDLVDKDANTRAGWGLAISTYCGSGGKYNGNQVSAGFMDKLMNMFEKTGAIYQVSGLPSKVDSGGGGTIAKYFAQRGIPTVDAGVPVAGMHSKTETIHIGDLYQAAKCFLSFLEG